MHPCTPRTPLFVLSLLRVMAAAGVLTTGCGTGASALTDPDPAPPIDPASAAAGFPVRLSDLVFACVGDSRPAIEDDTAGYPTNVVGTLFQRIEELRPRAAFVVSTGDYQFASTGPTSTAAAQIDLFMQARALYRGPLFPALGNHECTGATASNCGPGAEDGVTANYAAFVDRMLRPLGRTDPSYVVRLAARDGSWSAKLVFVAANAWSESQGAWLDAVLGEATTYTILVRHEPARATDAPGVGPSEAILARHPYTLALVGHSHTYSHDRASREVVIGNGGAPPTSSKDFGFGLFRRRSDGAIAVDMIDWRTGAPDREFHFAVRPDGSAAVP
jgi:hypothetical protein